METEPPRLLHPTRTMPAPTDAAEKRPRPGAFPLPALLIASFFLPDPSFGQGNLEEGIGRFRARDYPAAIRILEPFVKQNPRNAEGTFYLGSAYLAQRDAKNAAKHLEKAADLDRTNAEYTFALAQAYFLQVRDANPVSQLSLARKIRGTLERTIQNDPRHLEARYALLQFHLRAPGVAGGDEKKARPLAVELARLDPVRGHEAMADIYLHEKNEAAAERELQAAISRGTDRITVYNSLAGLLARQGRHEAAIEIYEGLLRAHPERLVALYHIGRLAAEGGVRLEQGEQALRRYLREGPAEDRTTLVRAHVRLGSILERKGDRTGAMRAYEAALQVQPQSREAQEALQRLRGARQPAGLP